MARAQARRRRRRDGGRCDAISHYFQRFFATQIPSLRNVDKLIGFVRRGTFVRYKGAGVLQASARKGGKENRVVQRKKQMRERLRSRIQVRAEHSATTREGHREASLTFLALARVARLAISSRTIPAGAVA